MGAQWKQKGRLASADAKGRVFTKLVKEISIAARKPSSAFPGGIRMSVTTRSGPCR